MLLNKLFVTDMQQQVGGGRPIQRDLRQELVLVSGAAYLWSSGLACGHPLTLVRWVLT
jgi:hypothetical protein